MAGPFKKIRKKRIENKINRLNSKIEDLQGEGMGVFQPEWDEGGKEVVKHTRKVMDLQDRLRDFGDGGAVGPNGIL
jgi:hypothetical protein